MDVLIRCFDEALVTYKSDTELSFRIKRGWEVFDKYYSKTEASPYYAAALILHPSYRTTYIQANWKKKWQKPAFKQALSCPDNILSMPAMSDEPERVFSGARRTISWERAQLDAKQVEKGECLKHWLKNDILQGAEGGGGSPDFG
ncbi:hypothetical protein HRG_012142 [Hirsutella rhossiliensis]